MDEARWFTTDEAAKYLGGITSVTVRRQVEAGNLVAYKIGRVLKFRQSDLDGFLTASRVSKEQPHEAST